MSTSILYHLYIFVFHHVFHCFFQLLLHVLLQLLVCYMNFLMFLLHRLLANHVHVLHQNFPSFAIISFAFATKLKFSCIIQSMKLFDLSYNFQLYILFTPLSSSKSGASPSLYVTTVTSCPSLIGFLINHILLLIFRLLLLVDIPMLTLIFSLTLLPFFFTIFFCFLSFSTFFILIYSIQIYINCKYFLTIFFIFFLV